MSQKHYTHLSYEERVLIEDWNNDTNLDKRSLSEFARHIGRNPGTISRELSRNGRPPTTNKIRVNKPHVDGRHGRGSIQNQADINALQRYWKRRENFLRQSRRHYTARAAEKVASLRVRRSGLKLEQLENEELLSFVLTALDSRWSPEQISGRIKLEDTLPSISYQAIYNFIYEHEPELGLKRCLRHKGKKYQKQKTTAYNATGNRRSIDNRPKEVVKLSRINDLEGDTIVGKDKTDRLLTHNDRKSGLVSISRVIGFDAHKISRQTREDITRVFYQGLVHTITYDNGPEFTLWQHTERQLHTKIYFAHAYCSNERGRNENTNGLIRDFLPKGTDFKDINDSAILTIESLLNNRLRKRLGWLTPAEYYASCTQKASVALDG